jgi:DNA-directed RNA polymerase sigma subunit (sigma70/sigma32)
VRRLTEAEKAEIRELYASTVDEPEVLREVRSNPRRWTLEGLGERYEVSRETIRRVLKGEPDA